MRRYQLQESLRTSPEGFTKRVFQKSPNGFVFTLNFEPGQTLPLHAHGSSDLFVVVLEGQGEAESDDGTTPIAQGTALWCEGREHFGVRNTGTARLSLLVVLYGSPDPKFGNDVR